MSDRNFWRTLFWMGLAAAVLLALVLMGCASASKADISTSQPVDVEQLSGQIVAKIEPIIKAEVTANVQGIGYTSQFGVGAVLVVSGISLCSILGWSLQAWWSHRREMKRLECGQHERKDE